MQGAVTAEACRRIATTEELGERGLLSSVLNPPAAG